MGNCILKVSKTSLLLNARVSDVHKHEVYIKISLI